MFAWGWTARQSPIFVPVPIRAVGLLRPPSRYRLKQERLWERAALCWLYRQITWQVAWACQRLYWEPWDPAKEREGCASSRGNPPPWLGLATHPVHPL